MIGAAEERRVDKLRIQIFDDSASLGRAAAQFTATVVRDAVAARGSARVVLATGNSQLDFVAALQDQAGVPWDAVTVFHLDEYLDLSAEHPASFRRWIRERITDPLRPAHVHYIEGDAPDPQAECRRYEGLLRAEPLDLVCMGIGENGHIAFNEPHQVDFVDDAWVRIIELDHESRVQQVGEGHFGSVEETAPRAITVTVPALLSARALQVVVPELRKAPAVRATVYDEVSPACPATILRHQEHAVLLLDRQSASLLDS
ncbi:glucosamine-6-phosphate deaminase [Actinopolymorpha sp. B17G11]|uniref:glucosamine-6-phosphate deaminase n=1 Tax=Actinopolymorpha sp. B17G11 TaxID=3160861 RepID=UPI0032E47F41